MKFTTLRINVCADRKGCSAFGQRGPAARIEWPNFWGSRVLAMSGTILVVDDNECIRDLLSLYLSSAGYLVLTAENAMVAGQFLREHPVDLLLADVEMPQMNGLGLVQALRDDHALASLPVIFVTSHTGYERRAKELGAVAYLTKPVRTSELFATVSAHLKRPTTPRRGLASGVLQPG